MRFLQALIGGYQLSLESPTFASLEIFVFPSEGICFLAGDLNPFSGDADLTYLIS